METSQTIGKISEALAKAQGQMKPANYDAQNPHFKSRFSSMASIVSVCRKALSDNGIAVVQGVSVEGDPIRVKVTTLLSHASGEWIKDTLSIKPIADNAQAVGSAISYAKRYSFSALVGSVSETESESELEDDGEAAVGRPQTKAPVPIRKLSEKPKAAIQKPEPGKLEETTAPVPATQEPVTPAPVSNNQVTVPPTQAQPASKLVTQANPRIAKIREIFTISGRIGQTPDQMKAMIGEILNLGRPIRESSEVTDSNIDLVLESFRQALSNMNKSLKEAA
ncbi:MAG: ERF family protein [Pseudomonadota bacterium]